MILSPEERFMCDLLRITSGESCSNLVRDDFLEAKRITFSKALSDREATILEKYYWSRKSLELIGKEYDCSSVRIRAIINNAIFKLRCPYYLSYFINGVEKSSIITGNTDIGILELNSRTNNALRRARINTLNDLCNLTIRRLEKVRNLGYKSILDINIKLNKLGFSLKEGD